MEDGQGDQDHHDHLNILDLPDELLCDIFECFRSHDVDVSDTPYSYLFDEDARGADGHALAAIQNARLVCRRFHDLASPLLVPVLRAHIDSASLHRIDGLTTNPHVASGVRLIQLVLGYRPRDVAQSLVRYKDLQSSKLRQLCIYSDFFLEFRDPNLELARAMRASAETYSNMLCAWRECCDGGGDGNGEDGPPTDKWSVFKDLLYQCYDEYRRRQDDQDRVLADGSYAATLAACAGRMTGLRALSFSDHMYRPTVGLSLEAIARPAQDTTKLREMMVMAQDWGDIEDMNPVPALPPARLLWEVPIALFESGVRLQEVAVSTLPLRSNFDMLCPRGRGETQPAWDRLRAAFRGLGLRRVDIGRLDLPKRGFPGHPAADGKDYTDRYIDAVLSGESLQRIDFDASGLEPGSSDAKYAFGSFLALAHYPSLRELNLSHVSFRHQELEAFINGLGGGLHTVALHHVGIRDGSWENPLELLRDKVMLSGRPIQVTISSLDGEGLRSQAHDDSDSHSDAPSWDALSDDNGEPLLHDMERYVGGEEGMANPLAQT